MSMPSLSASKGAFACRIAHFTTVLYHRNCPQVSEQPCERGELWLHRAPSGKGLGAQAVVLVNVGTAGERADATAWPRRVGSVHHCHTAWRLLPSCWFCSVWPLAAPPWWCALPRSPPTTSRTA